LGLPPRYTSKEVGAFIAAAMSDRICRKTAMQIGVISSTAFALLIPMAQTATQLVVIGLLTGLGIGFALSALRGHALAHGLKNTLLADGDRTPQ
jgi:MFS family permease